MPLDLPKYYEPLEEKPNPLAPKSLVNSVITNSDNIELINKTAEKYAEVITNTSKKVSNLTGMKNGTIIGIQDADTFIIEDNEGNQNYVRLASDIEGMYYDAIDKPKSINDSPFKQKTQIPYLEKIYNKPFEQITGAELENYRNYQNLMAYYTYTNNNVLDENKNPKQAYNPNKSYTFNPNLFIGTNINYQSNGFETRPDGSKGRELVTFYNPNNNELNTTSLALNYNQNSALDLNQLDNIYKKAVKENIPSIAYTEPTILNKLTNLPKEAISSLERSIFGIYSFARSKGILDFINFNTDMSKESKSSFNYLYNNPQEVDRMLKLGNNVDPNYINYTEKYQNDIMNNLMQGNYFKAFTETFTNIPSILANSSGDITLLIGGTILGGGAGTVATASKAKKVLDTYTDIHKQLDNIKDLKEKQKLLNKLDSLNKQIKNTKQVKQALGIISSNSITSISQLGNVMNEYRANNGKDMSNEQQALAFTALAIANGLELAIFGLGKNTVLNKQYLQQVLNDINKFDSKSKQVIFNILAKYPAFGVSGAALEGTQELMQTTTEEYFSQRQEDAKTLLEIATSPEALTSAFIGSIVGGTLGSGSSMLGDITNTITDTAKTKIEERKELKEQQELNNSSIIPDTTINKTTNTNYENTLNNITTNINNTEVSDELYDLTNNQLIKATANALLNDGLTQKSYAKHHKILNNIIQKKINKLENFKENDILNDKQLNPDNLNKEDFIKKLYYFSDKENEIEQKQITKLAESFNVSLDNIKKYDDVDMQAKYGENGYFTYKHLLEDIDTALTDNTLQEEQKTKLLQAKNEITDKLNNFVTKEIDKLQNIVDAINELKTDISYKHDTAEFKIADFVDKSGKVTNSKGFVRRYELVRYTPEDNKGIYKITNSTNTYIKDMFNILDNLTDVNTNTLKNRYDNINKNFKDFINAMKDDWFIKSGNNTKRIENHESNTSVSDKPKQEIEKEKKVKLTNENNVDNNKKTQVSEKTRIDGNKTSKQKILLNEQTKSKDSNNKTDTVETKETIYTKDKQRQNYIKDTDIDTLSSFLNNVFNENKLMPVMKRDINIKFEDKDTNISNSLDTNNSKFVGSYLSYIKDIITALPNVVKLTTKTKNKLQYIDLDDTIHRQKLLNELDNVISKYKNIKTKKELNNFIDNKELKNIIDTIKEFLRVKATYYHNESLKETNEIPKGTINYYKGIYGNLFHNIRNLTTLANRIAKGETAKAIKSSLDKDTDKKQITILNKFIKYINSSPLQKQYKKEEDNKTDIKNTELASNKTLEEKGTNTPKEEKVPVEAKSDKIITAFDEDYIPYKTPLEKVKYFFIDDKDDYLQNILTREYAELILNSDSYDLDKQAIKEYLDELDKEKENKNKNKIDFANQIETNSILDISKPITLHSGGADGADSYWGMLGEQYGIKANHYKHGDMIKGNTPITEEDAKEGKEKVLKAGKQTGAINKYAQNINKPELIRNWSQVKYSDIILAIGTMLKAGDKFTDGSNRVAKIAQVSGGTGYAVQMAINEGKPVYVYDQIRKEWYKNIIGKWEKSDTPTITNNFAGIGTRALNEDGKKAIRDVYEKSFSKKTNNTDILYEEKIEEEIDHELLNNYLNSLDTENVSTEDKTDLTTDENNLDLYIPNETDNGYISNSDIKKTTDKETEIKTETNTIDIPTQEEYQETLDKSIINKSVKFDAEEIYVSADDTTTWYQEKVSFDFYDIKNYRLTNAKDDEGKKITHSITRSDSVPSKETIKVYGYFSKKELEEFLNNDKNDLTGLFPTRQIDNLIKDKSLLKEYFKTLKQDYSNELEPVLTKLDNIYNRQKELNKKDYVENQLKNNKKFQNILSKYNKYKNIKSNIKNKTDLTEETKTFLEENNFTNIKKEYSDIMNLLNQNMSYYLEDIRAVKSEEFNKRVTELDKLYNKKEELKKDKKAIYKEISKELDNVKISNFNNTIINNNIKNKENIIKDTFLENLIEIDTTTNSLYGSLKVDSTHSMVEEVKKEFNKLLDKTITPDNVKKDIEKDPTPIFLYNKITDSRTSVNEFNNNFLAAINYTVAKFFTTSSGLLNVNPKEAEKKAQGDITLANLMIEHGMHRNAVIEELGKSLMRTLGIKFNVKTVTSEKENILISSLGNYAYLFARRKGYFIERTFIRKEEKFDIEQKKPISIVDKFILVKNNTNEYDKQLLKAKYELFSLDKITKEYGPKTQPVESTDIIIHDGFYLQSLNDATKEAHYKARKVPYYANNEAIDFVLKNEDIIKRYMGYIEDINTIQLKDLQVTAIGENLTIDNSLKHLKEYTEMYDREQPIYFNTFASKNGRFFLDTNTINIQTNTLHRFLFSSYKVKGTLTLDKNNKDFNKHRNSFAYGLLQGFGFSSDNMSDTTRLNLLDKIEQIDSKEIIQKFLNEEELVFDVNGEKIELEVDKVAHFINAMLAFRDYQQAINDDKKEVEIGLIIETDSATSGIFHKFMQVPFLTTYKKEMRAVGITVDESKTINELKEEPDFTDNYQNIAKNTPDIHNKTDKELEELHSNAIDSIKAGKTENHERFDKYYNLSSVAPKVFNSVKNLIPSIGDDGKVTKALRTMYKGPTMTYMYNIGLNGLIIDTTNKLMLDIFKEYNNLLSKTNLTKEEQNQLDSINNVLKDLKVIAVKGITKEQFNNDYKNKNIPELAKEFMFSNIIVQYKNNKEEVYDLAEYFRYTVGAIVGNNIWTALQSKFKPLRATNLLLGLVLQVLGNKFGLMMQTEEFAKKTLSEKTKTILKYKDIYPSFKLPYSNLKKEGMVILGSSKSKHYTNKYKKLYPQKTTSIRLNNNNSLTKIAYSSKANLSDTYANLMNVDKTQEETSIKYKYLSSTISTHPFYYGDRKFGSVGPIHALDGMLINLLQRLTPMLTIHDARVASWFDGFDSVYNYNKIAYNMHKDYSLDKSVIDAIQIGYTTKLITKDDYVVLSFTEYDMIKSIFSLKEFDDTNNYPKYLLNKIKSIQNTFYEIEFNYVKNTNIYLKFDDLYNFITVFSEVNSIQKQQFFNNNVTISNMDGINGTQYNNTDIEDINTIEKDNIIGQLENNIVKDIIENTETIDTSNDKLNFLLDENEFINNTEIQATKLLSNPEARLEVLDDLINNSNTKETNKKHHEYLKDLLTNLKSLRLDNVLLEIVKNLENNPNKYKDYYDITKNKIVLESREDMDISNYNDNPTRYAHELIHAVTAFALENANELGISSELGKLLHLYQLANKHLTVDDFIPDNSIDLEYDRKLAEKRYNYIFKQDKEYKLRGLLEFIAYGLTDPKLIKKLQTIDVQSTNKSKKLSILLKEIITNIFKLLIPNKNNTIQNKFPNFYNFVIGNTGFKNENIHASLLRLVQKVANADTKALNYNNSPFKAVQGILNSFKDNIFEPTDKALGKAIEMIITFGDKYYDKVTKRKPKLQYTLTDNVSYLLKLIGMSFISSTARKELPTMLSFFSSPIFATFKPYNLIGRIGYEIQGPDGLAKALEMFSLSSRRIEQQNKDIENVSYQLLTKAFTYGYNGHELSDNEKIALNKGILAVDTQSLQMDITDIKKLYTNETYLDSKIQEFNQKIKDKSISKYIYNFYINNSKILADYMVTGNTNSFNLGTAENIAKLTGTDMLNENYDEVQNDIDQYITLLAIKLLPTETKKSISNLSNEGLDFFLKSHKTYVTEAKKFTDSDNYAITTKGYVKQAVDNTHDIRIGRLKDKKAYYNRGFKLFSDKPIGKIDNDVLVLYKNGYTDIKHRNGATLMYSGQAKLGDSLYAEIESLKDLELYYNDLEILSNSSYTAKYKFNTLQKERNNKIKLLSQKEYSLDKLREIGNSTKGYIPIIDQENGIISYNIVIPKELKEEIGIDNDGIRILSNMHVTLKKFYDSIAHNQSVFDFLIKIQDDEYITDEVISYDKKKWVSFSKDNTDKFINELYNSTDKYFKQLLNQYQKNTGKSLLVREDMLLDIFGQSDIKLARNVTRKLTTVRFAVDLAERLLKFTGSLYKALIVIKTPAVLVGNILSNIALALYDGIDPITIFKLYRENLKDLQNYQVTFRRHKELVYKRGIAGLTDTEKNELDILALKMEQNPLHPLMIRGFMQNIVDDVDTVNFDNASDFSTKLNKIKNKLPKPISYTLDFIYMTENSAMYQIMNKATQYSDFLARAVEYKVKNKNLKEKYKDNKKEYEKKHNELLSDILQKYINYDRPQSATEQYLNDTGLVLFTKFAKRIQYVVFKLFKDSPIKSAAFLASQFYLYDIADVFEASILVNNDPTKYWYNPVDNVLSLLVPPVVHTIK